MKEEPFELIIKYLQGQLDEQGINDFYSWVNENAENKKVFFETKAIYDACHSNKMHDDIDKSWNRLLKKKNNRQKKIKWLQFGNYAAVSFITVCLTSLFLTLNKEEDKIATRYIGGDGLNADIVELPDGTQVCLGSKTVFYYENDYGKRQRTVYLEGEAYFVVAKQKDKPFIVKTKEQNIEALGTKFNVTAYASDSLLTTTLLEGVVRLTTDNISHQTVLRPNQQFIYNRNTHLTDIKKVDAKQFTAWTTGYYYFPEQSLEAMLYRLSHVYGVQFTVESDALNKRTFTGTFYRGQSIKDIMEIINLSIPIKYKIDDHHITVSEI
ncbi:FecR family protein [Parabacteroides faecis]|uniref:Ferric-dicitrate binding protein FerR (Iron transport regulator) n=1 Tax=Parabacteroides faecis TaxID=1217282 RepID=A0ABR6KL97_9BACT|nr:FecR domain-containing protein [Parabacteroides faecis]MBB4622181.1 ferric-dicitrate binding protein FerR (iron transport regulator) [Parabacteroides faecis]GGJ80750.1 iron dicitrate transporter FecR [Parabacteroides faecis]